MTPTSPITQLRSTTTNQLGASGLQISAFALGTMTFGVETYESAAFAQLDLYREQGGTSIDTADVYSVGESERSARRDRPRL